MFERVNLLRLFAVPWPTNVGSARVLEKAGYSGRRCCARQRVKFGVPRDQLLFARINPTGAGEAGA